MLFISHHLFEFKLDYKNYSCLGYNKPIVCHYTSIGINCFYLTIKKKKYQNKIYYNI